MEQLVLSLQTVQNSETVAQSFDKLSVTQNGGKNICTVGNQITIHINNFNQKKFQDYHNCSNIDSAMLQSLIPVFEQTNIERFCIKINCLRRIFSLDVHSQDTILSVKLRMQLICNVPFSEQFVIFDDKVLEDEEKLNNYNVNNDSLLHIISPCGENGNVIFFKRDLGRNFCLRVEKEITIEELKKRIEVEENLPVNIQRLFLDDRILRNECKICDYTIGKNIVKLVAAVKSDDYININVRTINMKILKIAISKYDTIEDLRHKIEAKGYPSEKQRIIFEGLSLDPEKPLSKYFLREDVVLHLSSRLRGGHMPEIIIHIRTSIGEIIPHGCSLLTTINDIKRFIESEKGFSTNHQKLFYQDMELATNSKTLNDYGITEKIPGSPIIIDIVLY